MSQLIRLSRRIQGQANHLDSGIRLEVAAGEEPRPEQVLAERKPVELEPAKKNKNLLIIFKKIPFVGSAQPS